MAIKMDNHEITTLELHSANGQAVTKQLTEELNLQTKTATQNGEVTADNGYDGLSKVVVNVQGGGGSYPSFADIYTVQSDIENDASKGVVAKLVDIIVAAYPNFYSAVLLDEMTVDDQIIGLEYQNASYGPNQGTAGSFLRYRNGALNKKNMTTTADGAAKAGTRYLIISHETAN